MKFSDSEDSNQIGHYETSSLIVIADDLTGALDTAVQFRAKGLKAALVLKADWQSRANVLAFTTDSRETNAEAAAARVRFLAGKFRQRILYKKIDSTLRGNVAAEIVAAFEESHTERVLVAPAFPSQGRTTHKGHQLIAGEPVTIPRTGSRAIYPASDSHIPTLLRGYSKVSVKHVDIQTVEMGIDSIALAVRKSTEPFLVFDALTNEHLISISRVAVSYGNKALLCGSAGFAAAIAEVWCEMIVPDDLETAEPSVKWNGPVLFVAGSRNPSTIEQINQLVRSREDLEHILLSPEVFLTEAIAPLTTRIQEVLSSGRHALFSISDTPYLANVGSELATRVGILMREVYSQIKPGLSVFTGGEIAGAICRNISANGLTLIKELMIGIPAARIEGGIASGLTIVTKAGGLGSPNTLVKILECTESPT